MSSSHPHKRNIRDETITYKEGDHFDPLNKKIKVLINDGTDYIVFLDENKEVTYYVWDEYDWEAASRAFAHVKAEYSLIEAFTINNLHNKKEEKLLKEIQTCLGECVSYVLSEKKFTEEAKKQLDNAKRLLLGRKKQIMIQYALYNLVGIGIALWLYWTFRYIILDEYLPQFCIKENIFQVTFCPMFGGLGAFLSFYQNSSANNEDVFLTKKRYILDSLIHTVYGIVCAFFMALAVKTNFILGLLNKTDYPSLFISMLCIVAGFNEKIIISLIKRVERLFVTDGEAKENENSTN